jgi:predicted TIM-barrel fold metal-dependent hydrolase
MNIRVNRPMEGWDCHVHVFDSNCQPKDGHYRPDHHPLAEVEGIAESHGVRHLVLVQPSVYGTDNSVLLGALALQPGRHRGVVVLNSSVSDAELDAMHAAGVRGARFNLVSPVGESTTVEKRFDALAPRLKSRGWHLLWYVQTKQLPQVAALHAGSGLTCVFDHLAGVRADTAAVDPAWHALAELASAGAWVKLSGWYRLGAVEPYAALSNSLRRVAHQFGPRVVWGSDWPHTAFSIDSMPRYSSTWQPVVDALGIESATLLRERAPSIYM